MNRAGHWSKNFLSILSNQMSRRVTYVYSTEQNQEKVGAGLSSLSYRYVPRSSASTVIPVCLASSTKTYARKTRLLWSPRVTVVRLADKKSLSRAQTSSGRAKGTKRERKKTDVFTCEQMSGLPAKFLDPSALSMARDFSRTCCWLTTTTMTVQRC